MEGERRREQPPEVKVSGGPTCPLCLDALTTQPRLEVCPDCSSIHHWSCVSEMGRCATPGCRGLDARAGAGVDDASRTLATVGYLTGLVGAALIGPLVIWSLARARNDAFASHHAQQATLLALCAILCGSIPLAVLAVSEPAAAIVGVIAIALLVPLYSALTIRSAIHAHRGRWTSFPLLRRLASEEARRLEAGPEERSRPKPAKAD